MHDPVAAYYAGERAAIAAELAAPEPGRWWFPVERARGVVFDRLAPSMHAVAAWAIDLAEPRHERRIVVHRS